MAEMDSLAEATLANDDRLDVLIHAAGILKSPSTKTVARRDIRFDVNTTAPFILTRRFLPILPADGRIVNLSSAAQPPVEVAAMSAHGVMVFPH